MAPSKDFEEGHESFDPNQVEYDSSDYSKEGGVSSNKDQVDNDFNCDTDQGLPYSEPVPVVVDYGEEHGRINCYDDVLNPEDSTYNTDEQYIVIDLAFRAQLQVEHKHDINHFLALLEIIPTKKKKRQQSFLDCTLSQILTSREYITKMEQLLAQKEAIDVEAKKKKKRPPRNRKGQKRKPRATNVKEKTS